eukprot:481103-Prymnesium_polylepis.1
MDALGAHLQQWDGTMARGMQMGASVGGCAPHGGAIREIRHRYMDAHVKACGEWERRARAGGAQSSLSGSLLRECVHRPQQVWSGHGWFVRSTTPHARSRCCVCHLSSRIRHSPSGGLNSFGERNRTSVIGLRTSVIARLA